MERDAFLSKVRTAMRTAELPDHPASDPGVLVPDLPDVDLVERFVERFTSLEGILHRGDPAQALAEISEGADPGPYMIWDEIAELGASLEADGRRRVDATVPDDVEGRRAHQAGYVDLAIGVTTAEAAFADSGTIVVRSGPGRPRMASLVPLVHVALLHTADIHRSLTHWSPVGASSIPDAANVVFISGPSRTADIEERITVGVHGPRWIHVVLVD